MKRITLSVIALCLVATALNATGYKPVKLSKAQVEQVKRTVGRDYLDPDSIKFRDIRAADVIKSSGKVVRRVCGEVNGKNAYGGYVGYTFFGGVIKNGTFKERDFAMPCEPW